MKQYAILSIYKVAKDLIVEVKDDVTPDQARNPSTWEDIKFEVDTDCWLYDVKEVDEPE